MKLMYCSQMGSSSPLSARHAAIASVVACSPRTTGAGSGANTRVMRKMMTVTPSKTGITMRIRLRMYLSNCCSFLYRDPSGRRVGAE